MKKTRQLFYQDWGTFHGTTLVACGWRDYAEPVAKLKQLKHDDRARAVDPMTENEAFAYQHTYLFDRIATKLNAALRRV